MQGLLERPEQDENEMGWYGPLRGGGSEDPKNKEDDGSEKTAGGQQGGALNGKAISNDKLGALEGKGASAAQGNAGSALPGESGFFTAGKELGSAMKAGNMSPIGRLRFAMGTRRGKATGITGIVSTVVIGFFAFSAGSLQIIHLKNNLLENSRVGRLQNFTLSQRTVYSVKKLVTGSGGYANKKTLNAIKLENKLDKAGFSVVRNEADNSVQRIIQKSSGDDIIEVAERGGDDAVKMAEDFNDAVSSKSRFFGGKATRKAIVAKLGSKISWIKDAGDPTKTPSQNVATKIDDAQDIADRVIDDVAAGTPTEVIEKNIDEANRANTVVDDVAGEVVQRATAGVDDAAKKTALETAKKVGDEVTAKGTTTLSGFVDDVVPLLVKEAPSTFGKLAGGAARAISITEPVRIGCTLRGTINFFSSIRNVMVFKIVATGFLRFLTVADEQQAGVIRSSALGAYAAAMNSNGGVMSSAAIASELKGTGGASSDEMGLLSNARAPTGIFGVVSQLLNNIPLINNATACKFAHNGLVIVGSIAVGAIVGFFSGGTSIAATGYASIALAFAEIAITTIGVPLFANYLEGRVSAAFGADTNMGGPLTAGSHAFKATLGPANGMSMTTRDALVKLEKEEAIAYKYKRSKESAFDRYFNIARSDSLLGTMAFWSPKGADNTTKTIASFATKTTAALSTGGISLISTPLGAGKAYAADPTEECYEDPQLKKHNVAVTNLCYPIIASFPKVDLDEAERALLAVNDIDGTGDPISEGYKDYISNCLSGRGGMLYAEEVDKDGKNDPADDTCVSPGGSIQGFQYGQNVYRQVYYGMMVDMDNLTEQINDEFITGDEEVAAETPPAVNNNVFVLGDSLTVGMQSLGGSVASRDTLTKELAAKGWTATVNAQGCRGVYQPNGPIAGDGTACPRESIVDGLTVVRDTAEPLVSSLKNSGTYVIGLGTNATERVAGDTDEARFKQNASDLIDRIRSSEVSPNATIYWVNLSLPSNKTRESQRNQAINDLVAEKNIKLIDWASHVASVNGNASTTDNVTFADSVHHDAAGYRKKVDFVVAALGQAPAGAVTANTTGLDCTGFDIMNTPTSKTRRTYSAEIQAQCNKIKNECAAGVSDTQRILCSALEFNGVYYGNGYSKNFGGSKSVPFYGFAVGPGNYGLSPKSWLDQRQPGLNPKNLLECSGLTAVALYKAYNFASNTLGCSGQFTNRNNPTLFQALTPEQIRPGDFLTLTFGCNSGGSGHVAIAASPVDANGNIIVYETNAFKQPVRFTQKNLAKDFPAGRSRFIPQGVQ